MKKFFLGLLVIALLGIGTGLYIAVKIAQPYSKTEPAWESSVRMAVEPESLFPEKEAIYVLVLGTDYNYTDKDIMYTKNSRSDTMMLVRLDLKNKSVRILSIPRDTRVNIPGDGRDRINSAYAIGGPKLSESVVQSLLNVPIDYWVRLKEQGLKSLVDAIGGIDLDVEKKMDYDDHWGHLHIHLKKGPQHLNGDKAAQYARFRHDEMGDYARMERQQKVMKAIQKRFHDPVVLAEIPKIAHVAKQNIESDLDFTQVLALGNLFKNTRMAEVETMTLPTVPKDYLEGKYWVSYVELAPDEDKKVLEKFTAEQGSAAPLRVEVLNGSGIPGKAQAIADKLRAEGFVISRVGNADRTDYAKTEIVDHTGQGEGTLIAKLLQTENTLSVPLETRETDITVIVGHDQ